MLQLICLNVTCIESALIVMLLKPVRDSFQFYYFVYVITLFLHVDTLVDKGIEQCDIILDLPIKYLSVRPAAHCLLLFVLPTSSRIVVVSLTTVTMCVA